LGGQGLTHMSIDADPEDDDEGHHGSSGGDPENSQGIHGPVRDGTDERGSGQCRFHGAEEGADRTRLGCRAIA